MDSKVPLQIGQGNNAQRNEPDERENGQARGKYTYGSHATPIPGSGQT
jgi:hypothetical protein